MIPSSITVSVTPVLTEVPARAVWKAITVTVRLVSHHSNSRNQVFQPCSQALFIGLGPVSGRSGRCQTTLRAKCNLKLSVCKELVIIISLFVWNAH